MSPLSTHDDSNRQTTQTRRRFVFGIGAATAAVAGCASNDDSPADDSEAESFDPASDLSYGKWLTTANDGMLFAYADLEAVPSNNASDTSVEEPPEDPLVTYPLVMTQTTIGLSQVALSIAGLTQAIAPGAASDSTVSEITVINRTIVAEGTFATEELDELLTEPTDETYGIVYEQTDTIRGYDQYDPAEVPDSLSDDPPVIAVADETVVVSASPDQLERMLAAADGDRSRIYESREAVSQLLEQAGTGDLVSGKVGTISDDTFDPREAFETDPQFEPRSSEDVVAALEFTEDGDTVESQFALAADDLSENRRETVETAFGKAAVAGSVSVDVNDERITASATYNAENLGLASSDSSGEQELSQAEAAELVSPESLALQYEPPRDQQFGELWVRVTEDTDAAAIRVEADSGGYTELQPQERAISADDNVAVQVDPDGDSVTVFAVNDDGATGELTTQSVPTDELSESAASQAIPDGSLSFSYEPPSAGDFGSLTVEVTADIDAETLVSQPQEAPGTFTDRVGSLTSDKPIGAGTTLETAVEPDGDAVIVYATIDGATGEVARWQGP